MFAPIDFTRLESALATSAGWLELGLVLACLAAAAFVDWLLWQRSRTAHEGVRVRFPGGLGRVVFPLLALALLFVARLAFQRFAGPPFFIDIALPLLVALAAIRMFVYGLRRLFSSHAFLKSSERALAFTIWGAVILYFTGVLPEIVAELDNIVLPLGSSEISLLTIGQGVVAVLVTLVITLWISGLLEQRLMRAAALPANTKIVLAKFLRALLLVLGILIALQAINFDLTLLTVFGGALGVGIGLGLQKLAANYFAGFTILLDRSIRLGDMITVDGRYGVVSRVTARYVVVRSLDGVEAIVPNETLATTTVLNHTYSGREVRVGVSVQVSYDCDVDFALQLMEDAAREDPRILAEPNPPAAFLVNFADNGINLELGVWLRDPENGQLNLKSALNRRILIAFRANGITIPSPRREVRVIQEAHGTPLA
ncbi:MAG: mechanosensitive ion channel [Betaproteobacteria bacterium]|nr:mechanosensitive ion channel [Betaproteobacteria bacterium]MBA3775310.1 mechanosensitive ion channel [Betaproteobacteria bacterium]